MILSKITPVDIHIAKKLREFRLIAGISQDKLGELTGVTFQQIQKYEKAKNRISASRLFEFSQVLNRPISSFYDGIKNQRDHYNYDFKSDEEQVKDFVIFNKEILPLVRAFNSIKDAKSKKCLIALAGSISEAKDKKIKHRYS